MSLVETLTSEVNKSIQEKFALIMLKEMVLKLCELANGRNPSPEIEGQLQRIISENDLVDKAKVPAWFCDLLYCLITGLTKERTFYAYNSSFGDISNFLAELENVIEAEWNDYGEAVEIWFPRLKLHACISTEGSFYEVKEM